MKINEESSSAKEQCVHNFPLKLRYGVTVVRVKPIFSYDSQNIIIAGGTDVRIFAIKSGECIQTLKYHTTPIIGLQESKKNMLQIFSCSNDGIVVRWDYTGKILQVYNLKMPVVSFYVPSVGDEWFITKKFEDQFRLYSLKPKLKSKDAPKIHLIFKPVQPKENAIAFDPLGKFVASVHENNLSIYKFESKTTVRHKTGDRKLTCVTCHPSQCVIATGDSHGRVVVWTNALESNHPVRSVYHWHTLPVADVAFSPEGSHLHSGGGESVFVKWNLFSEEKTLLPRMGAPIEYIIPSKDNSYVITIHSDNVLQVIDAQRNVVQVIQGLTKSQPLYGKLLPIGLLYNAHLKALVMNGKPGHLQFYDIKQDKQMFNLDIASKNFMSQERDIAVHNIDVQKAAVDDTGLWLATTEYWCNSDASPQIWLKFWEFNLEKQTFVLNTNVYLPHNKELNCILFRPPLKHLNSLPLAVTTSNDGRFKIWTLSNILDGSNQSWGCEYMGYYRDMIPTCASFSEDGSVLAVAFGRVASLWRVEGLSLKAVLLCKKNERDIKQLLFGHNAGFKYLICHDGFSITAWDCISLSIAWMIHYEIQLLVADVASDNIAAFCKDQNLKIFKPSSPQPLDYIRKVSDSAILTGIFVPSEKCNNIHGCFGEKSQLFFMDENQNLFTILEPDDEQEKLLTTEKKSVAQNMRETPFGMLQAMQTISDVKKAKTKLFDINLEQEETNIISNPTWQDPELLLKSILPKLLIPRKKAEEQEEHELPKEPDLDNTEEKHDREVITIELEEDWMSKALNNIEPKVLDFSFLTEKVKFVE